MSLNHARHNKEACEFLNQHKENKFGDWVITTAYYSALHYFHSELFPGSYESQMNGRITNFSSFEHYYNNTNKKKSKHVLLLQLVEENVEDDDVIDAFTTLKNLCWTARYKDYCCEPDVVEECYKGIDLISEYCEPVDVKPLKGE